jgi:hypothetical protein
MAIYHDSLQQMSSTITKCLLVSLAVVFASQPTTASAQAQIRGLATGEEGDVINA